MCVCVNFSMTGSQIRKEEMKVPSEKARTQARGRS